MILQNYQNLLRKLIENFAQFNGSYDVTKEIISKTSQLRSDLCDFIDAYIVVTSKITATNPINDDNIYQRNLALKNNAPFFSSILKINTKLIEDA